MANMPILVTVSSIALFSSAAALAQVESDEPLGLEEIVVTAQRTSENLQRSPVAVTALTAQSLAARQITSVRDLSTSIPNTLISAPVAVSNAARIFIRGVGQDNSGILADPAVAVYVDGVYMPRVNGALFDFSDVERVEVLRGPQGTLYGRNASGGAINIITKTPGAMPEFSADVAYGRFDSLDVHAFGAGPLIEDKLGGSVSAVYRKRDGIMTNTITGEKLNDRELGAVRAKLRSTPTDNLTITASADYTDDNSDALVGADLTNFPGVINPNASPDRDPFTTEVTAPNLGKLTTWGASLQVNYAASDWTLSSTSSFRRLDNDLIIPLVMLPTGPVLISFDIRDDSVSQEFNAAYDSERLKGVVGVYYFNGDSRSLEELTMPPRDIHRDTDAAAVYAQGTYKLTDTVGFTGGLRYTYEQTKVTQFFYTQRDYSQSAKEDWTAFTPKIGLEWQIDESLMAYASFTKGFKSGGFNAIAPNTNTGTGAEGAPIAYDPEKVKSYEAGLKYQSADNRFRLNGALFWAEYDGLQLPVYFPGTVNTYTSNATGARVWGVELEASYRPSRSLELYGTFSHQEDEYTSPFPCSDAFNNIVDCQDRQIKALIPTQASAGFNFTPELDIPGRIRLNGSWNYISGYWNNVSNTIDLQHTGAHGLVNASIAYETEDGHWTYSVEGKNLTDRQRYGAVLQFGNAVSPAVVGYPIDPRIVMARVKFNY